jgi:uncharacterized RDD family membrane protein YckC
MSFNTGNFAGSSRVVDLWDSAHNPRLFDGALSRRAFAFLIDMVVIATPVVAAALFIVVLGILTLGLGLILLWPLHIGAVLWALLYYGMTLGGSASATIGMRVMGLQMRTWNGEPAYFVLGAVHAILFWISVSVLSPLVLLVGLFSRRKQLLHDMVLGTVVIRKPAPAPLLAGLR